jgi:hypothetical protein
LSNAESDARGRWHSGSGRPASHVPLDGGRGYAGQLSGANLGLAPAEEPEDFHPALDTRIGVLVALGGESAAVVVTEGESGSGSHPWLRNRLG